MSITVIHTPDVEIEKMQKRDGWAISEFRLPITGETGSATTVFHSIFRPGSTHAKHLHTESDEIAVYLSGNGVVGQGNSRAEVSTGPCRLMPKGTEHFFYNETEDKDARVIGFYMGAPSVVGTGYKFCGNATPEDLEQPRDGLNDGILVHLNNLESKSWKNAQVQPAIGTHNGSPNALLHVTLQPGKTIEAYKFSNAEAIYYVEAGEGKISGQENSQDVEFDSFAFVPKGTSHEIENKGSSVLEMFLVLTGAGSLEEAA
jgi:mannose-6-phosphate isomerase-like protein (cupin superfamily)